MNNTKKETIKETLEQMKPGDVESFAVERLNAVRVSASNYGLLWNRKFITNVDRVDRVVKVTRLA